MFDIGFSELLVIGVLGLLVLGPEKLPKAARTLGLLVGRARRTVNNFQDELERQVRAEELREKLKDPYATFMADTDKPASTTEASTVTGDAVTTTAPTAAAATSATTSSNDHHAATTITADAAPTTAASQPRPQDTSATS